MKGLFNLKRKENKKTMTENTEILKALPVLTKISNTPTLGAYFKKTVEPLSQIKEVPEKKIMLQAIFDEMSRLYGQDTAKEVCAQIEKFPVVETGTHLAFLRDYDSLKREDMRSRLNQNVLISSALMRYMGQKYHIGVYGSNVNLSHPCSGGLFQLGDDIFPVIPSRQLGQVCLYDAPSIQNNQFNSSLPLIAKLHMLQNILTQEFIDKTKLPQKEMLYKTRKIIHILLGSVSSDKINSIGVEKQYNALNANNRNCIKSAMLLLSADAYKKYGYTFSDIDKQFQELSKVFERKDLKLPDQVALIQSNIINKVLDGTDIKHVSIDAVEVTRKFLIKSLEDKNSLWYKIFDNPRNFDQMHRAFIGIRGSWKENESPFDYVGRVKGFSKCHSLPLEATNHKPETLLPLLKNRQIIPSSALIILVFQSANMMAHGGFFQTTYADKIKKNFVSLLQNIGETERAEQLQKLPVDMALLSLAVVNDKTGNPMKLSEISRMSADKRKELVQGIPAYPSNKAVQNALPILGQYLDSTAPGYIQSEAAANTRNESINNHFNKPVDMTAIMQKNNMLGRAV